MKKTKPSKSTNTGKVTAHSGPFRVAACWPHQESPLLLSMVGSKRQIVIPTSFSPATLESLMEIRVADARDASTDPTMAGDLPRWLIALPYETFARGTASETADRPMVWNVRAGLVWDKGETEPRYLARPDAKASRFHMDPQKEIKSLLADARKWIPPEVLPIEVMPTTSDETYLESVRRIIDSIRNGDFYQVNLLRFFQAPRAHGWENLCARMESVSGPQGAIMTQGSKVLASLSPERFIEVTPTARGLMIETWPIKGTAPRNKDDQAKDITAGESLLKSEKDRAELHMIIDLMRNDLNRICVPQSVYVRSDGDLKQFEHVWHLEGHVEGILQPDVTFGHVLSALCPGGSITGAPKIAAIQRIREDEAYPRGFFMGNFFRINYDGSIQSNIMIRTVVSDNWMRSARYAAGSGIVIKSDPEQELAEIKAKCQPLTAGPDDKS